MSTSVKPYHHGDLRAALVTAAIEGLETGEPFSMRAVARRAGVSPAAPYRHFADRQSLEAAIAVEGFDDLRRDLTAALQRLTTPTAADVITAIAVAYVSFALRRPAVFRLMFGNECDPADADRVRAAARLHDVLDEAIGSLLPAGQDPALTQALWSMAHGLAFLHLDGKLRPEPESDVIARVQASVAALFTLSSLSTPLSERTPS